MTDAHCHPHDMFVKSEGSVNILYPSVANAWNKEQIVFTEKLKKERPDIIILRSFGIHPQLASDKLLYKEKKDEALSLLHTLPCEGRIEAVGETGFDLYDNYNKSTIDIQNELFILHLEIASKYNLPLVIHARKAMEKIFYYSKKLAKIPSVVFHSWSGTLSEAETLVKKGINVWFSFGCSVVNNHKECMRSASLLPQNRLLLETDSPYQPLRGKIISSQEDLSIICEKIANLRKLAGNKASAKEELEQIIDNNFKEAFLLCT